MIFISYGREEPATSVAQQFHGDLDYDGDLDEQTAAAHAQDLSLRSHHAA